MPARLDHKTRHLRDFSGLRLQPIVVLRIAKPLRVLATPAIVLFPIKDMGRACEFLQLF